MKPANSFPDCAYHIFVCRKHTSFSSPNDKHFTFRAGFENDFEKFIYFIYMLFLTCWYISWPSALCGFIFWTTGKKFVSVKQYQENVCLLDPRLLPERSYESGSAPPSFLSSVRQFSWDWLISFSSNSAWC